MAPEVMKYKTEPYLPSKVDIFNLGTLFFTIIFTSMPFVSAELSDKWYRFLNMGKETGFVKFFERPFA